MLHWVKISERTAIWSALVSCIVLTGCSGHVIHPKEPLFIGLDAALAVELHFEDTAKLLTTQRDSIVNDSSKLTQLKQSTPSGYIDAVVRETASNTSNSIRYIDARTTVEIQEIKEKSNTRITVQVRESTGFVTTDRKAGYGYACKHVVRLKKGDNGTWQVTKDEFLEESGLLPRPIALTFVKGAPRTMEGHPSNLGELPTNHTESQGRRGSTPERPATPTDLKTITPSQR